MPANTFVLQQKFLCPYYLLRFSPFNFIAVFAEGGLQGLSQEGGRGNFKLVMIQSSHRFGLAGWSNRLA